jgi:FkbM family methyltransferase
MKKIIYDFGANKGDDISYYLKRADLVVAVEADPGLCEIMRDRFQQEIRNGRVIVENYVITVNDLTEVPFYKHKKKHVLSQFPKPRDRHLKDFLETLLPARTPISIIQEHGAPYYIKIDVEHYDQVILENLFAHDIRPPYISAECHSAEVFPMLVAQGGYKAFKLVEGRHVHRRANDILIQGNAGSVERFSFKRHAAGPFGDDIRGGWLTAENCKRLLAFRGMGWRDVHATNLVDPPPQKHLTYGRLLINETGNRLRRALGTLGVLRK